MSPTASLAIHGCPCCNVPAMNATVTGLQTAAIKGTQLRSVDKVLLGESGATWDRRFFVIDERSRMLNGKQLGGLQAVVANYDGTRLELRFPDSSAVDDLVDVGEPVTARFLSSELEGRIVRGPWAQALSDFTGRELRLVETTTATDRGSHGSVSLVSRGSLRRLAEQAETDFVDGRRFRMLIEVDGVAPHMEDEWVGREVQVGESLLRFEGHVGRCLVTSRDPETGDVTLPTLDLLRAYRRDVDSSEPLPFGIYGRVIGGGVVRVGDSVTPV
jgi:uncharacterized protein YcbX